MKLIREIHESDIGWENHFSTMMSLRKASRAVLKRSDNKIAFLYVKDWWYHKLPGWGIEVWEDINVALQREIKEEVGAQSVKIWKEIWVTIEYKEKQWKMQVSYCYEATTDDTVFTPEFTESEILAWFELRRYDLEEALHIIKEEKPSNYMWKFIQIRCLSILKDYQELY